MPRIADKVSDDEAEGKASRDERRSFMDKGDGPELQDYECDDVNEVKPKPLKRYDAAKRRTAPERKAYAGAERGTDNVIRFPTVPRPKAKRYRRGKPWSPMDANDKPDPKFNPKDNPQLEIVKRRVPNPFNPNEHIEVDANLIGDQLGQLLARRQLTRAQFDAGRHLEELFEATETGALKSRDTTRDIIDCAQPAHQWCAAGRVDASNTLHRLLSNQFSKYHATIITWVIKDGVPIKTIATHLGFKDHKPVLTDLKDALNDFELIGKPDKWQRFAA
jgi:hypothetical protein